MSQDKLREHLVEVARRRRAREAAEAGGDGPTRPADPAMREALAPLDEAAKERITARVLKEIEAGMPPAATAPAEAPRTPPPRTETEASAPPAAKVIPFRRRWPAAAAVAVAAMAAVLVVSLRPDRLPPLPAYEATVSGETALRGSPTPTPAETPRVGPGSTLTLVARPKQVVTGPVEAAAFLVRGDSARPWEVPVQVSPEGAVRISGTTEALLPPEPGPWTAVIVIIRPGQPRASAADALRYARGASPAGADVQVIQARFDQTGP